MILCVVSKYNRHLYDFNLNLAMCMTMLTNLENAWTNYYLSAISFITIVIICIQTIYDYDEKMQSIQYSVFSITIFHNISIKTKVQNHIQINTKNINTHIGS